jgi:hypothetical protein
MTNSRSTLLIKFCVLITSLTIVSFAWAGTNKISLMQVTKDISYLASDELKGRDNYSPEIRLAADYIAKLSEGIFCPLIVKLSVLGVVLVT